MCCLFGFLDYGNSLSTRQKMRLVTALSISAEDRGVDATGFAFNSRGKLHVCKSPLPAHKVHLRLPADAKLVMGHTRLTTQGNAQRNRNNHPFYGNCPNTRFALAHNGVIYNEKELRRTFSLPSVKVETDSYVCVQLIEKKKALDFSSLRSMAEQLKGSFTITVMDERDSLWFVKGDNPMCLYHFPKTGLYVYASTKAILENALKHVSLPGGQHSEVRLDCGDILRIDVQGEQTREQFSDAALYGSCYSPLYPYYHGSRAHGIDFSAERTYLDELKAVAGSFGYSSKAIDQLYVQGFMPEEIEEFLYEGVM